MIYSNKFKVIRMAAVITTAVMLLFINKVNAAEKKYDFTGVADASDTAATEEVFCEGLTPVYGSNIEDGEYEVSTECSSSMFKIELCKLYVNSGNMTAEFILSGQGYLCLYKGDALSASKASEEDYIFYNENADGKYSYTVNVDALNECFSLAAYSKKKEKWYDRTILLRADSIPKDKIKVEVPDYEELKKAARNERINALKNEEENKDTDEVTEVVEIPEKLSLKDGKYYAELTFTGGSGKSSVLKDTSVTVIDGDGTLKVKWSSDKYDYMKVCGETIYPVTTEGGSEFIIPLVKVNEPFKVIADTVAMSEPHEIEYEFTVIIKENNNGLLLYCAVGIIFALFFIAFIVVKTKKQKTI